MATRSNNVHTIAVVQLLLIMLARALFGALVCSSPITTTKVVDRKMKLTKRVDESQGKKISHFSVEVEGGDKGRVLVGGYSNENEFDGTSYPKYDDWGGIRPNQLGDDYIGWGMGDGMRFDKGYYHRSNRLHNRGSSNEGGSRGNDEDNDGNFEGNNIGDINDSSSKGNDKYNDSSIGNEKDETNDNSYRNDKGDNNDYYFLGGGGSRSGWGYP